MALWTPRAAQRGRLRRWMLTRVLNLTLGSQGMQVVLRVGRSVGCPEGLRARWLSLS